MADERVTLLGLPLVAGRQVGLVTVDPALARELFIRHALVEGDWHTGHAFWGHNKKVLAEIEQLEARSRRRDLLEVGLGGRVDATNVVDQPAAAVVTPIGRDHAEYLGDTVEAVAG